MKKLMISYLILLTIVPEVLAEFRSIKQGEFQNHCAMSLALGKVVDTDCTISWTDTETEKNYCFSSERMKTAWLNTPKEKIKQIKESLVGTDVKEVNVYRGDSSHDH